MPEVTAFTVSELVWVNLHGGEGGKQPCSTQIRVKPGGRLANSLVSQYQFRKSHIIPLI